MSQLPSESHEASTRGSRIGGARPTDRRKRTPPPSELCPSQRQALSAPRRADRPPARHSGTHHRLRPMSSSRYLAPLAVPLPTYHSSTGTPPNHLARDPRTRLSVGGVHVHRCHG